MRLALRGGTRTCTACAHEGPAASRWCGRCGQPVEAEATVVLPDDPRQLPSAEPDRPREPGRVARRARPVTVVVAVVAVLVVAVLAQPEVTGDTALLGRLDVETGVTSALPPVEDLQLLWRRPVDPFVGDGGPPRVEDLPTGAVLLGGDVVDPAVGVVVARYGHGLGALSPRGWAAVAAGGRLTLLEVDGGRVVASVATDPDAGWVPVGTAVAWLDDAVVLRDAEGRLGVVERDGRLRYLLDEDVTTDGAGDGVRWLVAEVAGRLVVLDGTDGSTALDVGPSASVVHAPTVVGDTLVYVDPTTRGRPGAQQVVVVGTRLDGSGRLWRRVEPTPTAQEPRSVQLEVLAGDLIAVWYRSPGSSTTMVVVDEAGTQVGTATTVGTGLTQDGWPVATVVAGHIVGVDPARSELRAVDGTATIRWAQPVVEDLGVRAAGDLVLVHTPAGGLVRQERLRLLDAATGELRWDRVHTSTVEAWPAVALDGHVGVRAGGPVAFHELEDGRYRTVERLLGRELPDGWDGDDVEVVGTVGVAGIPRAVVVDGRGRRKVLGSAVVPAAARGRATEVAAVSRTSTERADDLGVAAVDLAGVQLRDAAGEPVWRWDGDVALRPGLTVLLEDAVVVVTVTGELHVLDRATGMQRWALEGAAVTATTAGGDVVVVGTADGAVLLLGPGGTVLQRLSAGQERIEGVAVVDGHVVGTIGADLFAFGRGPWFVENDDRVRVD